MTRLFSAALVITAMGAMASAQEPIPPARKSAPAPAPQTQQERAGYAIGLDIGRMFQKQSIEVDLTFLARGIRDGLAGGKPLMSDDEMRATLNTMQKEAQTRAVARAKAVGAKNQGEGQKFLAQNAKQAGVKTTRSGLQYKILKEGKGPSPKATDTVRTHYHGTYLNGDVFDSSVERGEPAEFAVNRVIPGWTEALQQMKVGCKWQVFVPPDLA